MFSKILAKFVTNYDSQQSMASQLRIKRFLPMLRMIEDVHRQNGVVKILDIGGTAKYWGIVSEAFLENHNVKITIMNVPGMKLPENQGRYTFMHGDGCNLVEFEDNAFDIVHSNSVVEHVGDWTKMKEYAREVRRLAPRHFVQTPNFWFPLEPHCLTPLFHWLPMPTRVWLVMRMSLGHWRKGSNVDEAVEIVNSARLLNKKMFRSLFDESEIKTEWLMLLPKSFLAIKGHGEEK